MWLAGGECVYWIIIDFLILLIPTPLVTALSCSSLYMNICMCIYMYVCMVLCAYVCMCFHALVRV